ncbi:unnamed protein product [Prunus armeniaca]
MKRADADANFTDQDELVKAPCGRRFGLDTFSSLDFIVVSESTKSGVDKGCVEVVSESLASVLASETQEHVITTISRNIRRGGLWISCFHKRHGYRRLEVVKNKLAFAGVSDELWKINLKLQLKAKHVMMNCRNQ